MDNNRGIEPAPKKRNLVAQYTVTNADKAGNTPAWKGYKTGKTNVKTGKPLYKPASHLKGA